ncbi:MAG: YadA-like family protein [Pyramidobacter sp.]|nr:YadA-like family protein [Pyramidobacter sp.]
MYDALYQTDKTVSGMKEHFTTKKLTVNGDSDFNGSVTVGGKLTANGPAVFNDTVTMNKGLDMNGSQIKNIAPGTDDGDAATYGQLKSVATRTDAMFTDLDRSIRRTGSRAAALAGLHPLPYDPDAPTTFTAAVGNYRGDTSVALGMSHHFSRDAMLSVASTVGKEPMLNAGLSLRLGRFDEQVIQSRAAKRKALAEKNRLLGELSVQNAKVEKQQAEMEAYKHKDAAEKKQMMELIEAQRRELEELKRSLNKNSPRQSAGRQSGTRQSAGRQSGKRQSSGNRRGRS